MSFISVSNLGTLSQRSIRAIEFQWTSLKWASPLWLIFLDSRRILNEDPGELIISWVSIFLKEKFLFDTSNQLSARLSDYGLELRVSHSAIRVLIFRMLVSKFLSVSVELDDFRCSCCNRFNDCRFHSRYPVTWESRRDRVSLNVTWSLYTIWDTSQKENQRKLKKPSFLGFLTYFELS